MKLRMLFGNQRKSISNIFGFLAGRNKRILDFMFNLHYRQPKWPDDDEYEYDDDDKDQWQWQWSMKPWRLWRRGGEPCQLWRWWQWRWWDINLHMMDVMTSTTMTMTMKINLHMMDVMTLTTTTMNMTTINDDDIDQWRWRCPITMTTINNNDNDQ